MTLLTTVVAYIKMFFKRKKTHTYKKKKSLPVCLYLDLTPFYIILENLNVGKIFPWHLSMGRKDILRSL